MRKDDKVRFNMNLSIPLYQCLHADSLEYGVPKSSIISMLLMEYYKGNLKPSADDVLREGGVSA